MISYHNDPALKESIVAEMIKHKDYDQFVKGTYNAGTTFDSTFHGCAVGCAIDSFNIKLGKSYSYSNHRAFEEAIGVPGWLAYLQDKLFEMLPSGEDSQFAIDFLEAIPVGIDLEPIRNKFCAFLMKENIKIVSNLTNISDELRKEVVNAIQQVLQLHENKDSIIDEIACSAAYSAVDAVDAARSALANSAGHKEKYSATFGALAVTSSAASSAAYGALAVTSSAAYKAEDLAVISVAHCTLYAVSAASSVASSAAPKYAAQLLTLLKNEGSKNQ